MKGSLLQEFPLENDSKYTQSPKHAERIVLSVLKTLKLNKQCQDDPTFTPLSKSDHLETVQEFSCLCISSKCRGAGSSVAGQAVLDLIGEMQIHTPPAAAHSSLLPAYTKDGLPDSLYLEKLAHSPAVYLAVLFNRALLSALQSVPDLHIKVRICSCCSHIALSQME
jgi:hypothetical protein